MRAAKFYWRGLFAAAPRLKIAGIFVKIAAAVIMIGALAVRPASVSAGVGTVETVLSFTTMAGVDDAFINNTAVRGVKGDELPWDVGTVDGSLTTDGHLHLTVTGIVFSNDPIVPPELRGINDEDQFRAVVSCLTNKRQEDRAGKPGRGHGLVATVNIFTEGFPATPTGDATIDTTVTLPNPCVAPIIFVVAGSEDKWFAVTGSYEDE